MKYTSIFLLSLFALCAYATAQRVVYRRPRTTHRHVSYHRTTRTPTVRIGHRHRSVTPSIRIRPVPGSVSASHPYGIPPVSYPAPTAGVRVKICKKKLGFGAQSAGTPTETNLTPDVANTKTEDLVPPKNVKWAENPRENSRRRLEEDSNVSELSLDLDSQESSFARERPVSSALSAGTPTETEVTPDAASTSPEDLVKSKRLRRLRRLRRPRRPRRPRRLRLTEETRSELSLDLDSQESESSFARERRVCGALSGGTPTETEATPDAASTRTEEPSVSESRFAEERHSFGAESVNTPTETEATPDVAIMPTKESKRQFLL